MILVTVGPIHAGDCMLSPGGLLLNYNTQKFSRRKFLAATLALPSSQLINTKNGENLNIISSNEPIQLPRAPKVDFDSKHLAWVWQFQHDGDRELIRDILSEHQLGLVIKTNDGVDWMSSYDTSKDAISGPRSVEKLATFFDNANVPLHAWTVVNGVQPRQEAEMAAMVLSAGAKSLFIDLEPYAGFWSGTTTDAKIYGDQLRQLAPSAHLTTSVDGRPWELPNIPLEEFANFTDAIAPQIYWNLFNTYRNKLMYQESGYIPGFRGITPSFALKSAVESLKKFNLPIHAVGDGTASDINEWYEFINESYVHNINTLSVWRFGVARNSLWRLLGDSDPYLQYYFVKPGDNLDNLAYEWNTTIQNIVKINNIANPNFLFIGQKLQIPSNYIDKLNSTNINTNNRNHSLSYTTKMGDSLWSIAKKFGVSVENLLKVNDLRQQDFIYIGQELQIPLHTHSNDIYSVTSGDSLWSIARGLNINVQDLARINNIKNQNHLYVGQELILPLINQNKIYTVQRGDSLWSIAKKFDTSIGSIKQLNRTNLNKYLQIGQKINIRG